MKFYNNIFEDVISLNNLFLAWDEFKVGKRKKSDVLLFERNLERNIFELHRELKYKAYRHGPYDSFSIRDPKPRNIHKALVRDRVVHHALCRILNPIFEPTLTPFSFSCRVGYGTHKGVNYLESAIRKSSKNNTMPCFVLKCDVKKFFDTVDRNTLNNLIFKKIKDKDARWLIKEIIGSYFSSYSTSQNKKGIPIGNLTSQLFANVYMNELDYFLKHKLRVGYYARYTDDFLIISNETDYLLKLIPKIVSFLKSSLLLKIHGEKLKIIKINRGVDFLGYISFPKYRLVRSKTKKRILRRIDTKIKRYKDGLISRETLFQSFESCLGFLSHANTHELAESLKNKFYLEVGL